MVCQFAQNALVCHCLYWELPVVQDSPSSSYVYLPLLFQCVVFRGRSSSVKPIISSQCRRFSSSLWLPMLLQLSSSRGLTPPHWVSGAWSTAVVYGVRVQSSLQYRHSSPGHTLSMDISVRVHTYVCISYLSHYMLLGNLLLLA